MKPRFTEANPAGHDPLDELRNVGAITDGLTIAGAPLEPPVRLHALAPGEPAGWRGHLGEALLAGGARKVAFTGPDPLLSAWLAAETAEWIGDAGTSAVLVDASVDRALLAKALADDSDEGLVDAVLFGVSPGRVARRTLAHNVSQVTAGSHPLSSEKVFRSESFERILEELGREAVVLVILPERFLADAASAFDGVVVAHHTAEGLSSLAEAASGASVRVGVLTVGSPQTEAASDAAPSGAPVHTERPVEESIEQNPEDREDGPGRNAPTAAEAAEAFVHVDARIAGDDTSESGGPSEETAQVGPRRVSDAGTVLSAAPERARRSSAWLAVPVVLAVVVVGLLYWRYGMAPRRVSEPVSPSAAQGQQERAARTEGTTLSDARPVAEEPTADETTERGNLSAATPAGGRGMREKEEQTDAGPAEERAVDAGRQATGMGSAAGMQATGREEVIGGHGGPYRIFVTSHRFENEADIQARQVGEHGVATEVVRTEVNDMGVWFRVAVSGGYPRLSAAREVLDTVKGFGYEGAWIERTDTGD